MSDPKPPIPIRNDPPNAEIHPSELRRAITPNEAFFVRCNFPVPQLDPRTHSLRVGGAVERPLSITVEELAALEDHAVEVTTECAGNGRIGMQPPATGEPWSDLAVSTAVWTGVPLVRLLDRTGIGPGAVEVRFDGADGGEKVDAEGRIDFARSLPLEKALDPDTLVALRMNGSPIPPEHGAPVRLIVPGWYGMASVKWLAAIHVLTEPFRGFFQQDRYIYDRGESDAPEPVARMRVRSLVHTPQPGQVVAPGPLEIRGWAWSGHGAVTRVEVALDGGDTWVEARLEPRPDAPHAWVGWSCTLEAEGRGRHLLRSRAYDQAGNVQPDRPPWNRLGYGQNAVRLVTFEVG